MTNRRIMSRIMTTTNRWRALDTNFAELLAKCPPLQVRRVESLRDRAVLVDDNIEEAEFLLSVASELVALQIKSGAAITSRCVWSASSIEV